MSKRYGLSIRSPPLSSSGFWQSNTFCTLCSLKIAPQTKTTKSVSKTEKIKLFQSIAQIANQCLRNIKSWTRSEWFSTIMTTKIIIYLPLWHHKNCKIRNHSLFHQEQSLRYFFCSEEDTVLCNPVSLQQKLNIQYNFLPS